MVNTDIVTNKNKKGLRLLEGTQVTNTTVNPAAKKDTNNFFGTVRIPNYSKVSFELVS